MTPRAWLETTVDAEHADEVLKHRQRLRKPLTDYAAKLLAKKLSQCPDPNAAAELMILKGWQSVEPAWVQRASGTPQSKTSELRNDLRQRIETRQGSEDTGFVRSLDQRYPDEAVSRRLLGRG